MSATVRKKKECIEESAKNQSYPAFCTICIVWNLFYFQESEARIQQLEQQSYINEQLLSTVIEDKTLSKWRCVFRMLRMLYSDDDDI